MCLKKTQEFLLAKLESQQFKGQIMSITILDSAGQAFFARQLEHIKSKSYDVVRQDLVARQFIPVSNEAPEGVSSITYRTYDSVGAAIIISSYADDLPRADVFGKETIVQARSIGSSFGYNRDEILQSQLTGVPLDQRRANAVSEAFETKVDDIAWNGDAKFNLIGLLNHPNVPVKTSITASGWVGESADLIIQDVNELMGQVRTTTKMKESPQTLLVPVAVFNYISGTPRNTNSDTTIMSFMLQNVVGISQIAPINELSDSAFLYDKNPDKLQMEVIKELEFLPPQESGLELVVPAWGKTAGTNVYYPLSAIRLFGV